MQHLNCTSFTTVVEHVSKRGGGHLRAEHHGQKVKVKMDQEQRRLPEGDAWEVKSSFVDPEMMDAFGYVLGTTCQHDAAPAGLGPRLGHDDQGVRRIGMNQADASRGKIDRVHLKPCTGAVNRSTHVIGRPNGRRHRGQTWRTRSPHGWKPPFPPTHIVVIDTVGKPAAFVHRKCFLNQGAWKVVNFDFCGTAAQHLTQGAERSLSEQEVFIDIQHGPNRGASRQGQHTGGTVDAANHKGAAEPQSGRVCEHDVEHLGTTAPDLEHLAAWPIHHLAPHFSGHAGV